MNLIPQNVQLPKKIPNTGITMEFYRCVGEGATAVVFKIPDGSQVLSKDPYEFMRWVYKELFDIAKQATRIK